MNTQKQILLIVVLFFTLVGGCAAYSIIDLPYRAPSQATWTKDQSVERGALLFANNCRTCHGIKGEGGVGLPLNKPEFKDQDPLILASNKQLLQTTLYCGRAGTRMPAWLNTNGGSLNGEQIVHLIDLITSPADPNLKENGQPFTDAQGNPSSEGWLQAIEFAHNLNRESTAVVGGYNLDGIAKSHLIGYAELAKLNNLSIDGILKQGSVLKIPGFKNDPNGYDYNVYKDNETITKVADSQHVGAIMIADLNNLPYKFTQNKEVATFTLLDDKGNAVPGLFPGTVLKLPTSAVYVVSSGDTLDDVAKKHGLSASDIRSLNTDVLAAQNYTDTSKPLESENRLKLPNGTAAVVQTGQTLGTIATSHGLKVADLATLNGLDPVTGVAKPGDKLKLPDNTRYIIAIGDTLASVANQHGITADALASAQTPKATDPLSQSVVLKLPQVDKFTTVAQTLEEVAKGYSNVTAESLATANKVPANAQLHVGQNLALPADSWGSAPPDTLNTGSACVQHAVPDSVYKTLLPGASPTTAVASPTTVSTGVSVVANANDYTVTADGKAQPPNEGIVLVAKGTAVVFTNKAGLHTIDDNGKNTGTGIDFKVGDTRTLTFTDSGQHKITCEVHPAMLLDIFVQ